MTKKSNSEYKKKKKEKRIIKRAIKNSEKNTGSIENAEKLMRKYAEKEDLEKPCGLEFTPQTTNSITTITKDEDSKELGISEEEENQIKKKFNDDQMYKEFILKLIADKTGTSYSTTIKLFDNLASHDKQLVFEQITNYSSDRKIPHLVEKNKNKTILPSIELNNLKSKKKVLQDEISNLQNEKIVTNNLNFVKKIDEKIEPYQKQVEEINRRIAHVKIKLHKTNISKIKCPQNLKKLTEFQFISSKILLDTNAILHMIYRDLVKRDDVKNKYEITHKIKTLSDYNALEVIIPSFVKKELKSLLENSKNKSLLPYFLNNYLNSELEGIFGEKIKKEKFGKEIGSEVKEIIKKYPPVSVCERPLSIVDAKCLLYARQMGAVLITNDQKLLKACKDENVLHFDHIRNQHMKYLQTTNSYLEEWFVGKIQRLKILWQEIQKSKNNKLESENEIQSFMELFYILCNSNYDVKTYLNKIFQSKDSVKNIKKFFDTLPNNLNLTLDEIDVVVQHV